MDTSTYNISLSYKQILNLVMQLPVPEKIKLSREIAKEATDKRLIRLLNSFETDEISEEEISIEVEKARADIYAERQKN